MIDIRYMKKQSGAQAAEFRRLAEERLASRPHHSAALSNVETARLIHELEVHQIELEMQNEELQKARAEVETEIQRYSDLYDFAPVG